MLASSGLDESSPGPPVLFLQDPFNIIFPSLPMSPQVVSFHQISNHKTSIHFYSHPFAPHDLPISSYMIEHTINTDRGAEIMRLYNM